MDDERNTTDGTRNRWFISTWIMINRNNPSTVWGVPITRPLSKNLFSYRRDHLLRIQTNLPKNISLIVFLLYVSPIYTENSEYIWWSVWHSPPEFDGDTMKLASKWYFPARSNILEHSAATTKVCIWWKGRLCLCRGWWGL